MKIGENLPESMKFESTNNERTYFRNFLKGILTGAIIFFLFLVVYFIFLK